MPGITGLFMGITAAAAPIAHANPFGLAAGVVDDVAVAIERVGESLGRVDGLIAEHGSEAVTETLLNATKDARLGAHHLNLEAQARLEPHLDSGLDAAIESKLRNADGTLEDVGWQLAKKPSPDGRFNGLDLAGARRDLNSALAILGEIVPF
jgi:hypothetical protein